MRCFEKYLKYYQYFWKLTKKMTINTFFPAENVLFVHIMIWCFYALVDVGCFCDTLHQGWPSYVWTCFWLTLGCLWPEIHLHCESGQNRLQKGWSWNPVCCSCGPHCCTGMTHCLIYSIAVTCLHFSISILKEIAFFLLGHYVQNRGLEPAMDKIN